MNRDNLIQDLVADLQPVKRAGRIGLPAGVWLLAAGVYTTIMIFVSGPLRDDAIHHLLDYPWFAAETAVAVACVCSIAIMALRSAIPSGTPIFKRLVPLLLLSALWTSIYVIGLWEPAHPVSMEGQRAHCVLQTLSFSLPSMALLLYYARRQLPLWPRVTGALAGAAAAAIPAAWMQFACMYVPSHILSEHLAPVLLMAVVGAIVGPFALNTRPNVPRSRNESVH
jgi:hypothetical protein